MASFITAGNATNGLQVSSDNTGILELKSGTGSGTTAVTVNASQNVGIGTSSPLGTLDVNSASTGSIYARGGSVQSYLFGSSAGGVGAVGTASNHPFALYSNNTERARVPAAGGFLVTSDGGGLGYGTGAGGTVTQTTNKSTAVTLNKPTGQITMNGAALGANTTVGFTLNNTLIAAPDTILVNNAGGNGGSPNYQVWVYIVQAGSCLIAVRNISGGSLSESVVINFAVIKGAST